MTATYGFAEQWTSSNDGALGWFMGGVSIGNPDPAVIASAARQVVTWNTQSAARAAALLVWAATPPVTGSATQLSGPYFDTTTANAALAATIAAWVPNTPYDTIGVFVTGAPVVTGPTLSGADTYHATMNMSMIASGGSLVTRVRNRVFSTQTGSPVTGSYLYSSAPSDGISVITNIVSSMVTFPPAVTGVIFGYGATGATAAQAALFANVLAKVPGSISFSDAFGNTYVGVNPHTIGSAFTVYYDVTRTDAFNNVSTAVRAIYNFAATGSANPTPLYVDYIETVSVVITADASTVTGVWSAFQTILDWGVVSGVYELTVTPTVLNGSGVSANTTPAPLIGSAVIGGGSIAATPIVNVTYPTSYMTASGGDLIMWKGPLSDMKAKEEQQ